VILIVTPVQPVSDHGNGVTARRWASILTSLGYQTRIAKHYQPPDRPASALVALHARKSADAVRAFHAEHPEAPIVLALTGTDLYPSLAAAGVDLNMLHLASRLVVLQPRAVTQLDASLQSRTRIVVQSVDAIEPQPPRTDCFEVAYLAHLRQVKDPLRPAAAARLLPASSRIRITHVGATIEAPLAAAALAESAGNPHYDWLGPVARADALQLVARSRLLVLTSWHEGGANVISEAIAAGTPVIASRIPGSVGLLGDDYPGYFHAGDAAELAAQLQAAETNHNGFYDQLRERCAELRPLVDPAREREAWASLLAELHVPLFI